MPARPPRAVRDAEAASRPTRLVPHIPLVPDSVLGLDQLELERLGSAASTRRSYGSSSVDQLDDDRSCLGFVMAHPLRCPPDVPSASVLCLRLHRRPGAAKPGSKGPSPDLAGRSRFRPISPELPMAADGTLDIQRAAADALAARLPDGAPTTRAGRLRLLVVVDRGRPGAPPRPRPLPVGAHLGQHGPLPRAARRRRACDRIAASPELVARIDALAATVATASRRPDGRPHGPGRSRAALGCAFLCAEFAVHALAAGLLGRARRARGRHAQGGVRPRPALRRRRAALPARLLPPAPRPVAAGSASTGTTIDPDHSPAVRVTVDGGRRCW